MLIYFEMACKFHKIPEINFEERQLTSFAGVLIFQMLFKHLGLKSKLKRCFSHLKLSPIFGHHIIVLLLIVHLILGFRRIREIDYYRDNVINLTEWLVSIVKTPAPIIKVPQVLSSRPYRFNSFYHYLLDIGYQPGHSL